MMPRNTYMSSYPFYYFQLLLFNVLLVLLSFTINLHFVSTCYLVNTFIKFINVHKNGSVCVCAKEVQINNKIKLSVVFTQTYLNRIFLYFLMRYKLDRYNTIPRYITE